MYSGLKNKNSNGFPYYVDLHVESGESLAIQLFDGNKKLVYGPATISMLSHQAYPPIPMPVQLPPGHMMQQIVDENGTLKHIILSATNPNDTTTPKYQIIKRSSSKNNPPTNHKASHLKKKNETSAGYKVSKLKQYERNRDLSHNSIVTNNNLIYPFCCCCCSECLSNNNKSFNQNSSNLYLTKEYFNKPNNFNQNSTKNVLNNYQRKRLSKNFNQNYKTIANFYNTSCYNNNYSTLNTTFIEGLNRNISLNDKVYSSNENNQYSSQFSRIMSSTNYGTNLEKYFYNYHSKNYLTNKNRVLNSFNTNYLNLYKKETNYSLPELLRYFDSKLSKNFIYKTFKQSKPSIDKQHNQSLVKSSFIKSLPSSSSITENFEVNSNNLNISNIESDKREESSFENIKDDINQEEVLNSMGINESKNCQKNLKNKFKDILNKDNQNLELSNEVKYIDILDENNNKIKICLNNQSSKNEELNENVIEKNDEIKEKTDLLSKNIKTDEKNDFYIENEFNLFDNLNVEQLIEDNNEYINKSKTNSLNDESTKKLNKTNTLKMMQTKKNLKKNSDLQQVIAFNLTYKMLTFESIKLKWTVLNNGFNFKSCFKENPFLIEMFYYKENEEKIKKSRIVHQCTIKHCKIQCLDPLKEYSFRVKIISNKKLFTSNLLTITTPDQQNENFSSKKRIIKNNTTVEKITKQLKPKRKDIGKKDNLEKSNTKLGYFEYPVFTKKCIYFFNFCLYVFAFLSAKFIYNSFS